MAFSPTPAATLWKYHTTESRTAVASVWSFSQAGNGCGAPSQAKRVFSSFRTPDCRPASELKILNVEQGGSRRRHWTGMAQLVHRLGGGAAGEQLVAGRSGPFRAQPVEGEDGHPAVGVGLAEHEVQLGHEEVHIGDSEQPVPAGPARPGERVEQRRGAV